MKTKIKHFMTYLSCCLNCGSLLNTKTRLCRSCLLTLTRWEQTNSFMVPPFRARALYEWEPGSSDILSKLLLSLKGSGNDLTWQHYARKFCRKKMEQFPRGGPFCIVPSPARKFAQPDHAFTWGKELATTLGAVFHPCLEKVSQGQQRGADRGQRSLIEMRYHENSTLPDEFPSETLWVFVDDILTTGATARAAHIALGCPKHFEVWVLAYRRLSCGASRHLL